MQLIKLSPIAGCVLATLLSACGGGKGDDPAPTPTPTIKVSAVKLSSTTPKAIAQTALQFDGGVCSGGNGTLTASWDFGDNTGTSSSNTHSYATEGVKTVTVTCSDTAGNTAKVVTLSITVASAAMKGFLGRSWTTYSSIDALRPSLYPVAGIANSGDVYGVWLPSFGSNKDVVAGTTSLSTDSWTVSASLPTGTDKSPFNDTIPGGQAAAIDLAVSPNGHAMAAWMAGTSIWYTTKSDLAASWSAPVQINVPVMDSSIKVVVNDAGEGAIAYCTSNGAQVITYASQTRQDPVTISKQCGVVDSAYGFQRHRAFDIAIDAASPTVYAVGISTANSGKSVVSLKSYTPGSGWTPATSISDELATPPQSLSYSRSPNGSNAAVAWNQVSAVTPFKSNVFTRMFANTTWGAVKAVQNDYITKDYTRPLIAVNDNGDAFLAMQLDNDTYSTQTEVSNYDASSTAGLWSKPFQLASSNYYANDTRFSASDIAIDNWGTGLITRADSSSSSQTGASQAGTFTKTGAWSGFSSISPPNTNRKSFHYQTMRALPDGRAILVTSIYDDKTPNTSTTKPLSSGYTLLK